MTTTLYQNAPVQTDDPAPPSTADAPATAAIATAATTADTIDPRETQDASRNVLLAVRRALVANWSDADPRIAVVERNGIDTVYVSTAFRLTAQIRADIRGAVRAALAPYAKLAPFTKVVFLTRGNP